MGCRFQDSPFDSLVEAPKKMQYLLLIYNDEQTWGKMTEAEHGKMMGEFMQFSQAIRANGHYQAGSQLQPTAKAKSVQVETASGSSPTALSPKRESNSAATISSRPRISTRRSKLRREFH